MIPAEMFGMRVNALLWPIDAISFEITTVTGPLWAALVDHTGFRAVQKVPGVGPTLAAIFLAEIGDVARFASPAHLSSWAELTPKHRESDIVVRRGPVTKQGSTLVRWAAGLRDGRIHALEQSPTVARAGSDVTGRGSFCV